MKIPTLVAGGAAARVHRVMPTVTYPSHTTMVTGVSPKVHGIVTNKPLDPLAKNFDGWRWQRRSLVAVRSQFLTPCAPNDAKPERGSLT